MESTNKPVIWKSILCIIPCLAIFFITRLLTALLLSFAVVIISYIPILSTLLQALLHLRKESPLILATTLSVIIAYLLTTFVQRKMMKDIPTLKLSRRILGIIIALVHILSFISNLIHGGNIYANILCFISGMVFVFNNED